MSTGQLALVIILASLSFNEVSARFFSMHLSLPSSSSSSSFSLCINQIGSPSCSLLSLADVPLNETSIDVQYLSNNFRSPILQQFEVTTSLGSESTRRYFSIRLSANQTKSLSITPDLIANVTLHCQRHYFGASCSTRCVSSDRQSCDSVGRPSCREGWTGEECRSRVASTVISSETTAVPTGNTPTFGPTQTFNSTSDQTQLLLAFCMVLIVILCAIVLYTTRKMSVAVTALAAPDHLTTPRTPFEWGRETEEANDASLLFKAACAHQQSNMVLTFDSDSVLDVSFYSAVNEESYMEL